MSSKIPILQRVRHPISCFRVCDVNNPRKTECMVSASGLDLTPSLWDDFVVTLNNEPKQQQFRRFQRGRGARYLRYHMGPYGCSITYIVPK